MTVAAVFCRGVVVVALGVLAGCGADPAPDPLPPPSRAEIARLGPSLAETPFGRELRGAVLAHPSMRAGAARVDAALAGVTAARAAAQPQISLGADLGASLLHGGAATRSFPVVQVTQLLFDASATRNRIRSAEAGAIRETIERENAAAALALAAAEAWHEVAFQRSLLALGRDNLATHEGYLEQIESRLEAGAGTEADLLVARSRTADAGARAVTLQGASERAEARFAEIYDRAPGRLGGLPPAPALPALSDAEVIAASPRMRSLKAELVSARAAAEAARATRFPALTLQLDGAYDQRENEARAAAGLSPRLDVGPGSERAAAIARSAARVAELEAEAADLERQVLRSLAYLRSDQRTGRARVTAARASRDASAAALEAAEEQFTIGRRSITQLLDARRDLFAASEALALAERDQALSGYAALALTGDILDVFGIILPLRADLAEVGG